MSQILTSKNNINFSNIFNKLDINFFSIFNPIEASALHHFAHPVLLNPFFAKNQLNSLKTFSQQSLLCQLELFQSIHLHVFNQKITGLIQPITRQKVVSLTTAKSVNQKLISQSSMNLFQKNEQPAKLVLKY